MYHDLRKRVFFTKGSLPGVSGRRLRAVTNFSSKLYIDPRKHSFYIGYCKQEKRGVTCSPPRSNLFLPENIKN